MKERENEDLIELDVGQMLKAIWQRLWLVILVGILVASICVMYTMWFVAPKYQSTAKLYVNNSGLSVSEGSFSISGASISAARSLVDTYVEILMTRSTLLDVIKEADLDWGYNEMLSCLSTSDVGDTEIFAVTVTTTDPYLSEKIANTIATVLPYKIAQIVDGSSVKVVDWAVVNANKVSPSNTKTALFGFFGGAVFAALLVVLFTCFNPYIVSEEALTQNYSYPLLAVIPDLTDDSSKDYYKKHRYGHYSNYYAAKKEDESNVK